MANKYTALPMPPKTDLEKYYFDQYKTQAEIAEIYSTSQKVIFSWFKKLGIKSRIPFKRSQSKEKNSSWKGDDATYSALHYRVEKERGKPSVCQACGTMDANIYEWANLTGRYQDTSDYMRMCRSCHRKYDKNRKNSSNHVSRTKK